jgi:Transglutaminase-like superfamily
MKYSYALVAAFVLTCFTPAGAQPKPRTAHDEHLYQLARTDLKAFAKEVSEGSSSELGETRAIVLWLTQHFDWKETDYKTRTVKQIVERSGGNCNDLALVAMAAMKELNIQVRRVHDVHIRTESAERGERARALVKEKGDSYSVFGRHHNDHVWIEVYDSKARDWFPADPWSGVVGTEDWMKARVWFGPRSSLNPDAPDMIVPFAIFAADSDGNFTINRTRHYLVDEFDHLYENKLHEQTAIWSRWVALLDFLSPKVEGAFAGSTDLLNYESDIDSLAATYNQLRAAIERKSVQKTADQKSDVTAFVNSPPLVA